MPVPRARPAFAAAAAPRAARPARRARHSPHCCAAAPAVAVAAVGNLATDVTLELPGGLPAQTGDHRRAARGLIDLGGSLNVLIAAQRLGAPAAPLGFVPPARVGTPDFLAAAVRAFGFARVDALVTREGYPASLCAVLSEPGRGATFLATNEEPPPPCISDVTPAPPVLTLAPSMRAVLASASAVVVDGYAVAGEPALVSAALGLAAGRVWYDPQSGGARRATDPPFRDALAAAAVVTATEDEARDLLAGLGASNVSDAADVAAALGASLRPEARLVVIKRGPRGCVVAHWMDFAAAADGAAGEWRVTEVPGFDVGEALCDTTGCGDSFLGALIAGLTVHGMSVVDACVLANATGAATAMRVGAGVCGVAERASVEHILKQNGYAQLLD